MLTNHLVTSSKMLYGLSWTETRKLAYNFAKVNQIEFPDSWEKDRQAGKTWYYGFMQRHEEITLRKPQATSLSRATSSNRHNVSTFFNKYRTLQEKLKFLPEDIYNIDESGITTVHNPSKVIAVKGIQRVANRKKRTRNITKKIIPESSSSSEEDNLEFGSSSSDDADWPPQDHTHEDDKENEPIIRGDFWMTKLEGKKKIHYYIAEIIDVSNEEAIKYLKKMDGSTNKFLYENEKT
ncbi:hypothetical protein JTB14_018366 [Gonioctena quinquepunctata]|nr:hypothetical protein JTB14_018366 [Gonioctena quinquepunctata]